MSKTEKKTDAKAKLFKKKTKGTPKKVAKTTGGPGKGHLRNFERLDRKKMECKSEVAKRFGNLIHDVRQKAGLSVREQADKWGMYHSYLNKIENGHCDVLLGTALGVLKKAKLPLSVLDSVLAIA